MTRLPHGSFLVRLLAIACLAGLLPAGAAAAGAQVLSTIPVNDRVVTLTFDAGADRGNAAQILDTLAANGIHASFGMTGQWASSNTDLLQRIVAEGHDIINHTWSHPSLTGYSTQTGPLSDAERRDQIQRTEQFILAQTGFEVQPLFRPPYGDEDGALLNLLPQLGYTVDVRWTIDTLGWNGLSAAAIRDRVRANVVPGAIIMMHVGAGSQDAAALPGVIADLRAAGYSFTTVRQALGVGGGLPTTRYFPETGQTVRDNFLRYWQAFGGLPVFGYPITGEIDQNGSVTQYFERARLELHPGSWPERFDIQLGLLGRELTAGREGEAPFQPL